MRPRSFSILLVWFSAWMCPIREGRAQELAEGEIVGPAHWAVGVSGGIAMRRERTEDGELDAVMHGALGGVAMVRDVWGPLGAYGMGTALPGWAQVYAARTGFVLGIPYAKHYGIRYDYTSYSVTETYAERIRSTIGLLGGGGFMAGTEGIRPHAEFGLGWMTQGHYELSALFDPERAAWGGRLSAYWFFGRGSVGGFFGAQMQGLSGAGHPAPMMMTLDFGLSDGFDME